MILQRILVLIELRKTLQHLLNPLEATLLAKAGKCHNEDVEPTCVEVAMLEQERIELDLIK